MGKIWIFCKLVFKKKIDFKNMKLSNDIKFQLWKIGKKFKKNSFFQFKKKETLDIINSSFFLNFAILKKNGLYRPLFSKKNLTAYVYSKSLFCFSKKLPFLICFNELYNSIKTYLRVVSPVNKSILKDLC